MMDDYTLPFWIHLAVVTVIVGGFVKKILASHLSAGPTLMAWLGATVLVERLWEFCLPALLLLGLLCCVYAAAGTGPLPAPLPARGRAVLITGRSCSSESCWFPADVSIWSGSKRAGGSPVVGLRWI